MKQSLFALCVLTLVSIGCSKEETPQPQTEVTISLDYSFVKSGGMTKAGDAVYTNFYEKHIKNKKLAPKTFTLTFKDKESGVVVADVKGEWTKNHSFKLPTGEYTVVGESHPATESKYNTIDSLYLSFNENITITHETSSINLTAQYDSYLLMFDADDKTSVKYVHDQYNYASDYPHELKVLDNIHYGFFNKLYGDDYDKVEIMRKTGKTTIYLDKIPFEKGKYYYFNDLSNSFDIPPMESGN